MFPELIDWNTRLSFVQLQKNNFNRSVIEMIFVELIQIIWKALNIYFAVIHLWVLNKNDVFLKKSI